MQPGGVKCAVELRLCTSSLCKTEMQSRRLGFGPEFIRVDASEGCLWLADGVKTWYQILTLKKLA